jgi:ribonuclease J
MPGVDYVIPDFTYLGAPGAFRGVVLTHGHEDHVGALSYLLRSSTCPCTARR